MHHDAHKEIKRCTGRIVFIANGIFEGDEFRVFRRVAVTLKSDGCKTREYQTLMMGAFVAKILDQRKPLDKGLVRYAVGMGDFLAHDGR